MTEKRYTPLLGATVVAIPALAAANVYVQMNVPLEPPLFSRTVHPASPVRDHGSRQEDRSRRRREPVPASPDVEPGRVPQARRERAPGLLPELRLLPRRQPGRQRHVRARAGPDPDQLRRPGHDRDAARHVPVLADFQGRPGAARGRRPLGHGDARLGEVPEGRGDLGRDPLPLRFHRPEAARQGGGTRNDATVARLRARRSRPRASRS